MYKIRKNYKYEKPFFEIIQFEYDDVIVTSECVHEDPHPDDLN